MGCSVEPDKFELKYKGRLRPVPLSNRPTKTGRDAGVGPRRVGVIRPTRSVDRAQLGRFAKSDYYLKTCSGVREK